MKTTHQKVVFKNCKAADLYSMFLNSASHTKLSGDNAAKISPKEGAKYSAHGGYCYGKNLQIVKNKLIVQSWLSSDWKKDEIDSTFILTFVQQGNDTQVEMIHVNIPDSQAKSLADGWQEFYWRPWKSYLETLKLK